MQKTVSIQTTNVDNLLTLFPWQKLSFLLCFLTVQSLGPITHLYFIWFFCKWNENIKVTFLSNMEVRLAVKSFFFSCINGPLHKQASFRNCTSVGPHPESKQCIKKKQYENKAMTCTLLLVETNLSLTSAAHLCFKVRFCFYTLSHKASFSTTADRGFFFHRTCFENTITLKQKPVCGWKTTPKINLIVRKNTYFSCAQSQML